MLLEACLEFENSATRPTFIDQVKQPEVQKTENADNAHNPRCIWRLELKSKDGDVDG